jgi:hypothetical protein
MVDDQGRRLHLMYGKRYESPGTGAILRFSHEICAIGLDARTMSFGIDDIREGEAVR